MSSFICFIAGIAIGTVFSNQIKAGTKKTVEFCKEKYAEWKQKRDSKVETYNATETVEAEVTESENPDA